MVRNDVTQPAQATGYMVLSRKGDGEAELLHDAGGNGQVNNADEPVADRLRQGHDRGALAKVRKIGTTFRRLLLARRRGWTPIGGHDPRSTTDGAGAGHRDLREARTSDGDA